MINGVAEGLFKSQNGLYLGHSSHLDNEGDSHFKNKCIHSGNYLSKETEFFSFQLSFLF